MFGSNADEVEQVDPDHVTRNDNGEAEPVRYEAVNAMLLNEFLKQHRKVEQQQAIISRLKTTVAKQETAGAKQQKEIDSLAATVREQTTQIQKVSAHIQASSP